MSACLVIEVQYDQRKQQGRIVLRPNRAASWRAKRIFLLVISALPTLIADGFAHLGAWLILLFAGLGMLLLAWLSWFAYTVHSRQEVVHFSDSEVLVDKWPQ